MKFSLGYMRIPEKVAIASRSFQTAESAVRDLMRPALKGIEQSNWEKVHSHLLDILIEGNEIANRIEIYREIGRISFVETRKLSHKIENHIDDIIIVKTILTSRGETVEQIRLLENLRKESSNLLVGLQQIRSNFLD